MGEFIECHSVFSAPQSVQCENAGGDGDVPAVYDADVFEIFCCEAGALIGAGEAGRDGDHHAFVALVAKLAEFLGKSLRRRLAGLGKLRAGEQFLIELLLCNGDAVDVIRLAKGNGERDDDELRDVFVCDIYGGIDDDSYCHLYSPPWLAVCSARLSGLTRGHQWLAL